MLCSLKIHHTFRKETSGFWELIHRKISLLFNGKTTPHISEAGNIFVIFAEEFTLPNSKCLGVQGESPSPLEARGHQTGVAIPRRLARVLCYMS